MHLLHMVEMAPKLRALVKMVKTRLLKSHVERLHIMRKQVNICAI